MTVNAFPHDTSFRMLGQVEKVLFELARLSLSTVLFALIDTNWSPRTLPSRLAGFDGVSGEADLVVLFKLLDGRFLLVVWEHKSYYAKFGKLQLARDLYCKAHEVVESNLTEGEMPILCAVYVTHREASKNLPKMLDELASLTQEEKKGTMNTLDFLHLDLSKIGLKDLSEDPEAGAPLLLMATGWDGRQLDDEELAYVARAAVLYPKAMSRYIAVKVLAEQRVPFGRWEGAVTGVSTPKEKERVMDITTESLLAKGRAEGRTEGWTEGRTEGLTEGRTEGWTEGWTDGQAERDELGRWSFLQAALLRFNSIPEYREAQVRDASLDQIKVWFIRLHDAPDLDSVFDGGDNGDTDD